MAEKGCWKLKPDQETKCTCEDTHLADFFATASVQDKQRLVLLSRGPQALHEAMQKEAVQLLRQKMVAYDRFLDADSDTRWKTHMTRAGRTVRSSSPLPARRTLGTLIPFSVVSL
jgi:hypothetical protein